MFAIIILQNIPKSKQTINIQTFKLTDIYIKIT